MFKSLTFIVIVFSLFACSATQAPPYQKDRTPEDRDQYSGAEGLVQYQKDQVYLRSKEISDKCNQAKIDLAVAQTNNNSDATRAAKAMVKRKCI